jgi:ribosomal protein S4
MNEFVNQVIDTLTLDREIEEGLMQKQAELQTKVTALEQQLAGVQKTAAAAGPETKVVFDSKRATQVLKSLVGAGVLEKTASTEVKDADGFLSCLEKVATQASAAVPVMAKVVESRRQLPVQARASDAAYEEVCQRLRSAGAGN